MKTEVAPVRRENLRAPVERDRDRRNKFRRLIILADNRPERERHSLRFDLRPAGESRRG